VAGLVQGGIRILLLTLSNASGADRVLGVLGTRRLKCCGGDTHIRSSRRFERRHSTQHYVCFLHSRPFCTDFEIFPSLIGPNTVCHGI
jgi:hypothetical protein